MRFWGFIVCDNVLPPEITNPCEQIGYGPFPFTLYLEPDPEYQCGDPPLFEGTLFITDRFPDALQWCDCGNPGTGDPPSWAVNIVLLW
jgi:hypothetical protein